MYVVTGDAAYQGMTHPVMRDGHACMCFCGDCLSMPFVAQPSSTGGLVCRLAIISTVPAAGPCVRTLAAVFLACRRFVLSFWYKSTGGRALCVCAPLLLCVRLIFFLSCVFKATVPAGSGELADL